MIGLCAEEVPCGEFGREALANAGVTPSIDTDEPDVRALLTKVEAGEVDAGIVYVTDVMSTEGAVEGIEIPEEENVLAEYPIVALGGAPNPDAAAAFVEFVLSDDGQAILGRLRLRDTLNRAAARRRRVGGPPALLVVLGGLGLALFVVPLSPWWHVSPGRDCPNSL